MMSRDRIYFNFLRPDDQIEVIFLTDFQVDIKKEQRKIRCAQDKNICCHLCPALKRSSNFTFPPSTMFSWYFPPSSVDNRSSGLNPLLPLRGSDHTLSTISLLREPLHGQFLTGIFSFKVLNNTKKTNVLG